MAVDETGPVDAPLAVRLRFPGPCSLASIRTCAGGMLAGHDHLSANARFGRRWRSAEVEWGELEELWEAGRVASFVSSDLERRSPYLSFSVGTQAEPMRLSVDVANPQWSREVFDEVRRFVFDAIETLGARSGWVGFRDDLGNAFRDVFGVVMASDPPNTLRGYDWLQIVPAQAAGDLQVVDLGPTPIQPLAQRDRLRAALLPFIGDRGVAEPDRNPVPSWIQHCCLASSDGGVDLGERYELFARPFDGPPST